MGMASRIATLRGIVYAGAIAGDLADAESTPDARAHAGLLQAWLLPIIKNSGAETGFAIAADAVLLFGGAGYTREWPVEALPARRARARHLRRNRRYAGARSGTSPVARRWDGF